MTGSGRRDASLVEVVADREELRARRDQFLAGSSAEYEVAAVDADEIADLLDEARRRR